MILKLVSVAFISYILCQLLAPADCFDAFKSQRNGCQPGCHGMNCEHCTSPGRKTERTSRLRSRSNKLKIGGRGHSCKPGCFGFNCQHCTMPGAKSGNVLSGRSGGQHCKPGCFGYECDYCTTPTNPGKASGRSLSVNSKGNCQTGCFGYNCQHCTSPSSYGTSGLKRRHGHGCKPGCFGYNCSICKKAGGGFKERSNI